ncbi:nucleoside deaminase [Adhaeribacter rhizoryzae]|uniref:Nucleoside deaminase n=1 Tax=Adhaeribacter rhizoryzae TaxID=2607907 RepID=A0A5M6DBL1_9BACT|nr:nucleoside deaminase [Adhaeribacter rhizoryzae]KAA5544763.1 nucleoside deaminase [Adhaeribacter rhizoryzae]
MENKEAFMRAAIQLSVDKMKEGLGGPFGAVVVQNGVIIARGFNNVLSSNDPTAHAEVDAIRKACAVLGTYQLTDCDLYTSCEPCPMCLGAIYWARPRQVYFANTKQDAATAGFDDQFIYDEIAIPLTQRSIPMQQMLRQEAQVAFQEWQKKMDRREY